MTSSTRVENTKRKQSNPKELVSVKRLNVIAIDEEDSPNIECENHLELIYFNWVDGSPIAIQLRRLHELATSAIAILSTVQSVSKVPCSKLWCSVIELMRIKRRIVNADVSVLYYPDIVSKWRVVHEKFILTLAVTAPQYFKETSVVTEWMEKDLGIDTWHDHVGRNPCFYCGMPCLKPVKLPCCKTVWCFLCLLSHNIKHWHVSKEIVATALKTSCYQTQCKPFLWHDVRPAEPHKLASTLSIFLPNVGSNPNPLSISSTMASSSSSPQNMVQSLMSINESNTKMKLLVEWIDKQSSTCKVVLILLAHNHDIQARLPHYTTKPCVTINSVHALHIFIDKCKSVETTMPYIVLLTCGLAIEYSMQILKVPHSIICADLFFETHDHSAYRFLLDTLSSKHLLKACASLVLGSSDEPGMRLFLWSRELVKPKNHSTGMLTRTITSQSWTYVAKAVGFRVDFEYHSKHEIGIDLNKKDTYQIHRFLFNAHHFVPHPAGTLVPFTERDWLSFQQYKNDN